MPTWYIGGRRGGALAGTQYQGPGEIGIGLPRNFWGLRAVTLASIGSKLIRLTYHDTFSNDYLSIAGGGIDLNSINADLAVHGAPITVARVYDQVGTNDLIPVTAPNFIQFAPGGSLIRFNGTNQSLKSINAYTQNQPLTFSGFFKLNATGARQNYFEHLTHGQPMSVQRAATANTIELNAGVGLTAPAADGVFHALQWMFSSPSNAPTSNMSVDGGSMIGNAGTSGVSADTLFVGQDGAGGNFFNGDMMELGLWPTNFAPGQCSAMSGNQHGFYG